jgi:hypothetical protein
MSRRLALGLLLSLVARPLLAQEPQGVELGLMGVALIGQRELAAGGLTGGWRPGGGVRLQLGALVGAREGGSGGRAELACHLLLAPARVAGLGVYALGGIAATVGGPARADLVLGLGVETGPAARWGVALEAGVGGGVRLALALRRRWLHRAGS